MVCPKCGSENIDFQIHQENRGSSTVTETSSTSKERGHGCLWWLLIGWWWWAVDLIIWICFFPFRLLLAIIHAITKKRKYKTHSTSVATTANDIQYKSICLCKNCGNVWENN